MRLAWRHNDAFDVELIEAACEDEAGGTGFVADFEVLKFDLQLFSKGTKGSFGGEIGAAAGPVVNGI